MPALKPSIADALGGLSVIELLERATDDGDPPMWVQLQHGCGRIWIRDREAWGGWAPSEGWSGPGSEYRIPRRAGVPFRMVAAHEADKPPMSRGPIEGE